MEIYTTYDFRKINIDKEKNKRYFGDIKLDDMTEVAIDELLISISNGWRQDSIIYIREYTDEEKKIKNADYYVVEGNRRTTCIKLLEDFENNYKKFESEGLIEELKDQTRAYLKEKISNQEITLAKPVIFLVKDEFEELDVVKRFHTGDVTKKRISTLTQKLIDERDYFLSKEKGYKFKGKLDFKDIVALFRYFEKILGEEFTNNDKYSDYKNRPTPVTEILLKNVVEEGVTLKGKLNISIHENPIDKEVTMHIGDEKKIDIFNKLAIELLNEYCKKKDKTIKSARIRLSDIKNSKINEYLNLILELEGTGDKKEDQNDTTKKESPVQGGAEREKGLETTSQVEPDGSVILGQDNVPPKIILRSEYKSPIVLNAGTIFNPNQFVNAYNQNGEFLKCTIIYESAEGVNVNKPGTYSVKYTVTNEFNQSAFLDVNFIVVDPNKTGSNKPKKGKAVVEPAQAFYFTDGEICTFSYPNGELSRKIQQVISELHNTNFVDNPVSITALFRILIELCCRKACDAFNIPFNEKSGLGPLVKQVLNRLSNKLSKEQLSRAQFNGDTLLDDKNAKELRNFLNTLDEEELQKIYKEVGEKSIIDILNLYIHKENPVTDDIVRYWHRMKPFLIACLRVPK